MRVLPRNVWICCFGDSDISDCLIVSNMANEISMFFHHLGKIYYDIYYV